MATKLLIRGALSALLSVVLLSWLWHSQNIPLAWDSLHRLSPAVGALFVLAQGLSYFCRAARLHQQFKPRLALGRRGFLRLSLLHNLGVNYLPLRSGELLLPAFLQRAGLPLKEGLACLFWLRLQDAMLLALGAILLWPTLEGRQRLLLALLYGLALLALRHFLPRLARSTPWFARNWAAYAPIFDTSWASWAWSWANWTCKLVGLSLLFATLSASALPKAAAATLGGELSALLPIQGMAGFGTYEAGVVALASLTPPSTDLLAAAVALHCASLLLATLAGGLAWFIPTSPAAALPAPPRPSPSSS